MNRFRLQVWFILVGVMAMASVSAAVDTNLYVSPQGNDAWSGTLPVVNADRSDGPFATLTHARDAIRALRTAGKPLGTVRIQLREGRYLVTEPVIFGQEDSGTVDAPVYIEAYSGEHPVLDGGRRITNWRQEGEHWVADIPEAKDAQWAFSSFFVNGERRTPARTPNAAHPVGDYPEKTDCFSTTSPVLEKDAAGNETKSKTQFHYQPGEFKAWKGLEDAVVVVYHSWETSLLRVKAVDEATQTITFVGGAPWGFCAWTPEQRFYVENLLEGLDQPGEWCLERKPGRLHYLPKPGENMANVEAVAPVAQKLLLLHGECAAGKYVQYLYFEGIGFQYTDYPIGAEGHSDSQAAFSIPAAVEAVGARHCVFDRCTISHVATYGLWWFTGSQQNQLLHSELYDLGAGAVRIGDGKDAASENEVISGNVVDNCFLHDGGRIFRGAVGAWIGRSSNNTLSHNEICDFRYTGISVGWSWGYTPSSANHNIIEFNNVHNIGKGQLADMGGIYTLGDSPGTIIRNNFFHDVVSYKVMGWGIYFDEGSTGILAQDNIVYGTSTGSLHQHYGKENRVVNNILAFSGTEQLIRSRQEEHMSFFFERNIVYFNNGRLLGSNWDKQQYQLDSNCYWDTSKNGLDFAGKTFLEWQGTGQDIHSIVADPMFENPEKADFTLKPGSPALMIGFRPFDTRSVGLYGESAWIAKPRIIAREPFTPPTPPDPYKMTQNFEDLAVDVKPTGASCNEEGAATIRVTDETAVSGKHSLKFTDAAGIANAFNPHLYYTAALRMGRATGSFSVRLEAGALFQHEWRSAGTPYIAGPSIEIRPSGELAAGGKVLCTVPIGQWVGIEIQGKLGAAADGTFALKVTVSGQPPQQFDALPCSDQFKKLGWWGFVSNATEKTVFYLDDLSLAQQPLP